MKYRDVFKKILKLLDKLIQEKSQRQKQIVYFRHLKNISFQVSNIRLKVKKRLEKLNPDETFQKFVYQKLAKDCASLLRVLTNLQKYKHHANELISRRRAYNNIVTNVNNDINTSNLALKNLALLPESPEDGNFRFLNRQLKEEIEKIKLFNFPKKFKTASKITKLILYDLDHHLRVINLEQRYKELCQALRQIK